MKILIAESKTMRECDTLVDSETYRLHRPELDTIASHLMRDWCEWPVAEIASAFKVSTSLAAEVKRMAYEFPNKSTGCKALEAYTGVVFKALDYASLSYAQKQIADSGVCVISSLYGLLHGDDIVKPYRLDYTTRVAPTGEAMSGYWKPVITPMLLDSMRDCGETEILDLMPADAAKCLDWRMIKRMARVVKVDFRSIHDGGTLKTPHSTLLKTLRGRLLRDIIQLNIRTTDALASYHSPTMYAAPDSDPATGKITILCE
jgi:hypothetical protein